MQRTARNAFTLIELSIVIAIIGLLIGGVLAGKSLIHATEIRSVITEQAKYKAAANAFRDEYHAMPGDMRNAYAFWGDECGTNTSDISSGCNGNGNGTINSVGGENAKAWEHLSLAGLIEGKFDGTGSVTSNYVVLTKNNTPASRFPNVNWDMADIANDGAVAGFGIGTNYVVVGKLYSHPAGNLDPDNTPMTNVDGITIDKKIDDGHANTGNVRGSSNCADNATDYYSLQVYGGAEAGGCQVTFVMD